MKNVIPVLSILLVLTVLLSACAGEPETTIVPTTEPTAAPTTEPTEAPTTEPTEVPTTEPTDPASSIHPDEIRQEGRRLTEEELLKFEQMFTRFSDEFSLSSVNYYNMALSHTYQTVDDMRIDYFFNDGFSNIWSAELDQKEIDFYCRTLGVDVTKDIYRYPADQVEWVLRYYLGKLPDELDLGMVYNPDTDCYYLSPSGAMSTPSMYIVFHDGYYDSDTGMVSLYYNSWMLPEERMITLQSKKNMGEAGYYIVSNVVVRDWWDTLRNKEG